jgi:hypothetical protein
MAEISEFWLSSRDWRSVRAILVTAAHKNLISSATLTTSGGRSFAVRFLIVHIESFNMN